MDFHIPAEILLWVLVPLAAIPLFLCLLFWVIVRRLSGAGFRFHAADPVRHKPQFVAAARYNAWAEEQGFEWHDAYLAHLPQQVFFAVWKQPDAPRFFCYYTTFGVDYCEFETEFDNGRNLCTCSIKDEHTFPPAPGNFLQTFHKASHAVLWERHLEAEDFLARNRGLSPFRGELAPYDELALEEARERLRHPRSMFLWPVRGVWWYVTSGSKTNKSIEQQDRAGGLAW
jgi:hypothetical protein